AEGEIDPPADMDAPPDRTTLGAAFKDTPADALAEILTGARSALRDVEGINTVFDERLPGQGPDLDPLVKLLRRVVGRLASEIGEPEVAASEEGQEEMPGQAVSESRAPPAAGEIASSRDVELMLDRLIAYYARHEPSSPV